MSGFAAAEQRYREQQHIEGGKLLGDDSRSAAQHL
jgi:hypothetical protein